MFAAQHFEYRVYAFAASQIFDRVFVITLLVVDAVLQSECFHPPKLFVGRRRPVHFDSEQLSNLYCCRSYASSCRMNQHSRSSTRRGVIAADQACLPVGKISCKVIDWESCSLPGSQSFRHWPQ